MHIKASVVLALTGLLAELAVAAPPACLLAALNTQFEPWNLKEICGPSAEDVRSAIFEACQGDAEAAEAAFAAQCETSGYTVDSIPSSTTSADATESTSDSAEATSDSAEATADSAEDSDTESASEDESAAQTSAEMPKMTDAAAAPTGAEDGFGNETAVATPEVNGTASETSAPPSVFTGAAARSLAGSFAGVAVVAAGFVIAL
ncbi:MAG: hypothetical protein M1815_003774 [Lichina confinis]|nr:MAG: hypothetical protein M1815_003774 [Lichina confinis]